LREPDFGAVASTRSASDERNSLLGDFDEGFGEAKRLRFARGAERRGTEHQPERVSVFELGSTSF
jgi:hypothetical protein